jgi:catechol 2,3-dioxygenase-like lactoylglutathione lyase family enzyme
MTQTHDHDQPERDWHLQSIFHFTVNATNFERSIDFYKTIGFRVLRDNRDVAWPPTVAYGFGMNRANGRGALLGLGDGPEHTRLDLLEWLDPPYDPTPAGVSIADRVPRIIALRTSDVRAAYRDLSAQGVEFVSEVLSYRDIGIEAVVCCRDPDGLLVEFMQYMPGVLGSLVGTFAKDPNVPVAMAERDVD